jgi:hypothetical protein
MSYAYIETRKHSGGYHVAVKRFFDGFAALDYTYAEADFSTDRTVADEYC